MGPPVDEVGDRLEAVTQDVAFDPFETNALPELDLIGDRVGTTGELLSFTATASDPDLPAQGLTFSLAGEVPAGASIDPVTGVFEWTPTEADDYEFAVVVTDDGPGALFRSETIVVVVSDPI